MSSTAPILTGLLMASAVVYLGVRNRSLRQVALDNSLEAEKMMNDRDYHLSNCQKSIDPMKNDLEGLERQLKEQNDLLAANKGKLNSLKSIKANIDAKRTEIADLQKKVDEANVMLVSLQEEEKKKEEEAKKKSEEEAKKKAEEEAKKKAEEEAKKKAEEEAKKKAEEEAKKKEEEEKKKAEEEKKEKKA
ncbi:tol-Pal system protein TolA [Penaeus vannamei]|uniref:Uncharacterized protein n=1 Tax=Penaeus vannamei TaxID=6689 RepID=A0A3R7STW3_PENVA|nr:protein MNN4-like [Penaeus vannamei]ROT74889.1 hypothetical protein C7M84_006589 [Penaeus vannamei]